MKLSEIKTRTQHYFLDDQDRYQGEYKAWYPNGQQSTMCNYKDGEFKHWILSGELYDHRFFIDGKEIINFIDNPELYPTTPEEKTMFALKYGSAPFIGNTNATD